MRQNNQSKWPTIRYSLTPWSNRYVWKRYVVSWIRISDRYRTSSLPWPVKLLKTTSRSNEVDENSWSLARAFLDRVIFCRRYVPAIVIAVTRTKITMPSHSPRLNTFVYHSRETLVPSDRTNRAYLREEIRLRGNDVKPSGVNRVYSRTVSLSKYPRHEHDELSAKRLTELWKRKRREYKHGVWVRDGLRDDRNRSAVSVITGGVGINHRGYQ